MDNNTDLLYKFQNCHLRYLIKMIWLCLIGFYSHFQLIVRELEREPKVGMWRKDLSQFSGVRSSADEFL